MRPTVAWVALVVEIASNGNPSATVLTHLDDLPLLHGLRVGVLEPLEGPGDGFDLQENAARGLLEGYHGRLAGASEGPARIVVVGSARVAEAVIVQLTYAWPASMRGFPLQVELVGEDSDLHLETIAARRPELADHLAGCTMCACSPMATATRGHVEPADRVIIDLGHADHAVAVVLSRSPPVGRGVPGLVVRDVSMLARNPDVLDTDSSWQLAYSLPGTYRQGDLTNMSPEGVPWDEPTEHIQNEHRAAIMHMLRELPRHGRRLTRASREFVSRSADQLAAIVDPELCEQLTRSGHARGVADRSVSRDGPLRHHRSGEERDQDARTSTRVTVASWSRLLLRLGYQIEVPASENEIADLFTGGRRYRRIGAEVRAVRVKAPTRWLTGDGYQLEAAAGDWMLEGSDRAHWSISDEALRRTYRHLDDDRYRPVGTAEAVELSNVIRVGTPEGETTGQVGDWLLRNELGHVWVIDPAGFAERYEPV